jgi:hypothetical protein
VERGRALHGRCHVGVPVRCDGPKRKAVEAGGTEDQEPATLPVRCGKESGQSGRQQGPRTSNAAIIRSSGQLALIASKQRFTRNAATGREQRRSGCTHAAQNVQPRRACASAVEDNLRPSCQRGDSQGTRLGGGTRGEVGTSRARRRHGLQWAVKL